MICVVYYNYLYGGFMDDIILCATIAVNCIENDPANVKRGEPKYLGFVFNVKREEAEEMMKFIEETLNSFNVPYEDIYVYRSISLPVVKVWTKERIVATISKDANYFIEQSNSKSK